MKKLLLIVGLLFLASSCGYFSKHGHHHSPEKMLSKMDTNGDGKISKAEFDAHKAKKFSKYDKNGDGELSADELGSKSCCCDSSKCGSGDCDSCCGSKKDCDGKTCDLKKKSCCDSKKDCSKKSCKLKKKKCNKK